MLRGGVFALGCLAGAAIIVAAVPIPHAAEPVTVSYRSDRAELARLAPYPAVAPVGLSASWQPVSSRLTVGGAYGTGTITWHLGFMLPDGSLASLEESNASATAFIRQMTNSGTTLGPVDLAGQTWTLSSAPSRGQRSMYFTSAAGFTIVVTGDATWAELRKLASALRPVA